MEKEKETCQNCNNALPVEAKYCPSCSQKVKTGKVAIREFIQEFFDTVFNLDSKLFQTLGGLFIPGKLTKEYFEGRRKSYAPPIRVFFIMLLFFLTILNFRTQSGEQTENSVLKHGKQKQVERTLLVHLDSVNKKIQEEYQYQDSTLMVLDTLVARFKNEMPTGTQTQAFYVFSKKEILEKVEVPAEDVANLNYEELCKKYNVEGFFDKWLFVQMAKVTKDQNGLNRFLLGSSTWMAFLFLPFLAMLFKVFYRKQKHYFIEHLVFLFHIHSYALLMMSGVLLFVDIFPSFLKKAMAFSILIYVFFAFKFVYQQGWGKTFLKYLLLGFTYILAFSIFMLAFAAIGFLIF